MRLKYVIKFVSDMPAAVDFYERRLMLTLKFQSPYWSEFETGTTTLALHPATDKHPAGSMQLGFNVDDLDDLYARREDRGIEFTAAPRTERGVSLASFIDSEGVECRVSG